MKFVIFDIDHTIARSHWRDGMKPPNSTWAEYHDACINDKVHEDVRDLLNYFESTFNYSVLGMTRRPEKHRVITNKWMMQNNVKLTHFFMTPDTDFRDALTVKLEMIEKNFTEPMRRDIAFYIDDDPDICAAVTEKFGITTFNIRFRANQ